MANPVDFKYAPMFQMGEDDTEYRLLTKEGVSTSTFEGKEILKVTPEALTLLAQQAFHDVEFCLRRKHNEQVAAILSDPEASDNDRYVALTLLRNAETSAKGILPRRGRGFVTRCVQHLHRGQPALLSERTVDDVRRGEHQVQPARTDRH